jgi:uncharacterized glyoxalase superfamily protein PhnB
MSDPVVHWQALSAATALGAQVIVPRQVLPDGDEMAVIAGPEGIAWGLTRRARSA